MAIDPAISWAVAGALAALLAAGAVKKALAPADFISIVRDYRIAPALLAPPIAISIIAVEAAFAFGLLVGPWRPAAAIGAALLFTAYGAAIGVNIMRGRTTIDCGCSFGSSGARLSPLLLVRNAILAAAALLAATPTTARSLGGFDLAVIGLFGLTAAFLYLAGEALRGREHFS